MTASECKGAPQSRLSFSHLIYTRQRLSVGRNGLSTKRKKTFSADSHYFYKLAFTPDTVQCKYIWNFTSLESTYNITSLSSFTLQKENIRKSHVSRVSSWHFRIPRDSLFLCFTLLRCKIAGTNLPKYVGIWQKVSLFFQVSAR